MASRRRNVTNSFRRRRGGAAARSVNVLRMISRALIFGSLGQVGSALQATAPPSASIVAHDLDQTDIRDRVAVDRAIVDSKPDIVINCAAFTNVDGAESRASEAMEAN